MIIVGQFLYFLMCFILKAQKEKISTVNEKWNESEMSYGPLPKKTYNSASQEKYIYSVG